MVANLWRARRLLKCWIQSSVALQQQQSRQIVDCSRLPSCRISLETTSRSTSFGLWQPRNLPGVGSSQYRMGCSLSALLTCTEAWEHHKHHWAGSAVKVTINLYQQLEPYLCVTAVSVAAEADRMYCLQKRCQFTPVVSCRRALGLADCIKQPV